MGDSDTKDKLESNIKINCMIRIGIRRLNDVIQYICFILPNMYL